ncbi:4-hydroxy-3-methylbut-2-enyl diphosphate reductase IspH [Kibdelosporangium banguiense]|uniref:4-hydroxy-3-methylbut-2-enyl diphosphate reductase IspH n=1 Tax=Kibdelosporangium banguiense TaxID=1365924 RepID=A0ABS4TTZ5_9PSEU|nr:4-hydroxy-3-methylbut-2-enyl diphosphate reductase IspH [Kibdelosporangium banguiense]
MAGSCDVMFVLGGGPETGELAARLDSCPAPVHIVDRPEWIRPSWLAGAASVGLTVTPSAPPSLGRQVLDILSGLGPLSVVRRQVTTGPAGNDPWPSPVGASHGRHVSTH